MFLCTPCEDDGVSVVKNLKPFIIIYVYSNREEKENERIRNYKIISISK